MTPPAPDGTRTLIDELLAEQRTLTAVDRFSRLHETNGAPAQAKYYRDLIPLNKPKPGEQYAFEVDLDKCSGCKACVSACHSLNGLDENEMWRNAGLLIGGNGAQPYQQIITTACHHCVDPGCLNGCPVLAYDKDPVTGIVCHLDDQCIGCSYCVMKCPYEVPKYSSKLGIVRKCDMCTNRLAVGEAPACVQACPHEAIRITVVNQNAVISEFKTAKGNTSNNGNQFLPDSPDPKITLPTTRYITKRELPKDAVAADHSAPRLDHAHWPLVVMLVLTQAAAGMFLATTAAQFAAPGLNLKWFTIVAFGILSVGLVASVAHLGQPFKAWRAFLGWRTSWLSREIIAFNAFAGMALLAVILSLSAPFGRGEGRGEVRATTDDAVTSGNLTPHPNPLPVEGRGNSEREPLLSLAGAWSPAVAAFAGLVAVFVSGMIYVDTKRPLWTARFAFGNFFGTALLLGPAFAAAVASAINAPHSLVRSFSIASVVVNSAIFFWRWLELASALNNSQSPIHLHARAIRELLPWTLPAMTGLFVVSIASGLLTFVSGALVWPTLLTASVFSSEIIARYIFFVAGAGKRMPGGVSA